MSRRPSHSWVRCVLWITGGACCFPMWAQESSTRAMAVETSTTSGKPLRELNTDRPDVTESPFTVDVGHVQIEADFFSHTRTNDSDERIREWSLATTNLRFGVSPNVEVGVFIAPWTRQVVEPVGSTQPRVVRSGFGDVTLRGKINFIGDDGGPLAVGLISDLTLPSAARDLGVERTSALVLLPITAELPGQWTLGAMTGADWRRSNADDVIVWINSASLSHAITDVVEGYFELTSEAGDGAHVATFDTGLTFKVHENLQLDCGINIGISRAADDLVVFTGIARRF